MLCVTFSVLAVAACARADVSGSPDHHLDSRAIVSRYVGRFSEPPREVPSFHAVDGPITGNGDIGLTVSGPPECQRYWISKNDFWKSGPDFKQCGPSLIGGIDVQIPAHKGATYDVKQVLYEPVIASTFSAADSTVKMDARVFATANVMAIDLKAGNAPVTVALNLWAKDGYGSVTDSGEENGVFWVTRSFNADNLLYPTEATIALRICPAGSTSFTLEPGKTVTVMVSVMTNHESANHKSLAQQAVRMLTDSGVNELRARHDAWWRDFWAKSCVTLADELLEKHYYASLYIMACCSRNANFPPGLYGNWITVDRTAWAGDIHLNYNHEAPFWALYSSNRVGLTDCYDAPLLEHLDIFKEDARTYLNKKGAYASVGIGPKGLTSRFSDKAGMDTAYKDKCPDGSYYHLAGQPMFLGQKSNAVFAGMNMILRYHYTYDLAYIQKVYPYLSEVAAFWEDYLVFENGRYVINDDSFGEVGPWQGRGWEKRYGDFNPITSLGFLRAFFGAMIEISRDLNRDEVRRRQWSHILDNLSDFPVVSQDGRKRFRACGGGHGAASGQVGLNWIMLHSLVYPACNIGLSSDPENLKMIRDDMKEWTDRVWVDHGNAFQTVFIGAARVGYDPDFLMAKARAKITKYSCPNLWIRAGGGGIETCSGIPGMINEMMLQSHRDVIRVFPVFPSGRKAAFYQLRTFGAFLVSSAIDGGRVRYVVIESEKGRQCNILNPWPGQTARLLRNGKEGEVLSGDMFRLATKPGEYLALTPFGMRGSATKDERP
jgi:hypothetical protein